jgi:hypothetical protein
MKKVKVKYRNRKGLCSFSDPAKILGRFPHLSVTLTDQAKEKLEQASVKVDDVNYLFVTPPEGLVVVKAPVKGGGYYEHAARLASEPPWEGERDGDYWLQGALTPCPKCGAALVWYEYGFVPGYRVCAGPKHHHVMLD